MRILKKSIRPSSSRSAQSAKRQSGFSLIEVLVAVALVSIGISGIAKLQGSSLRTSKDTRSVDYATFIAGTMIDRMRANTHVLDDAHRALDYEGTITGTMTQPSCVPNCSGSDLAHADQYDWLQMMNNALPAPDVASKPKATIEFKDGTHYQLTIEWTPMGVDNQSSINHYTTEFML